MAWADQSDGLVPFFKESFGFLLLVFSEYLISCSFFFFIKWRVYIILEDGTLKPCASAGTGNTVIEAVRVLIEHGVQPKHIILLSLFSTPHGKATAHQLINKYTIENDTKVQWSQQNKGQHTPTHTGLKKNKTNLSYES